MKIPKNLIILAVISFIFPTVNFAADNADACSAFLTLANSNLIQSGNETDADLLLKSSLCSASYVKGSTEAAEIEAAYKVFSDSFNAVTADAQGKYCASGFDRNAYRNKASMPSKTSYSIAKEAWQECRDNSATGVNFVLKPSTTMQSFGVNLSTLSSTPATLNGISQSGLGRSTCKATIPARSGSGSSKLVTIDEATTLKFDVGNKLFITCDRQALIDTAGNYSSDAQVLTFKTSAGTYNVNLTETGSLSRVSLAQVKADIQTEVSADTTTQLNKITPQIEQVKTDVSNSLPIGTIVAWHKNIGGTPALANGWVECNGQTLSDAKSVYDGKTIPNLNGEGRFLRGSSSSGTVQEMDWKSFYVRSANATYQHDAFAIPKSGWNTNPGIYGGSWGVGGPNALSFAFDDSEVRPKNMSVVWIMKVKN